MVSIMNDFNTYTIKDMEKGEGLYELLRKSIQDQRLVPIIGAGFTKGSRARSGCVPNAGELKEELIDLLVRNSLVEEDDADELRGDTLQNVASLFTGTIYPDNQSSARDKIKTIQEEYRDYVRNHFTEVDIASGYKKMFLKCGWPYIYIRLIMMTQLRECLEINTNLSFPSTT